MRKIHCLLYVKNHLHSLANFVRKFYCYSNVLSVISHHLQRIKLTQLILYNQTVMLRQFKYGQQAIIIRKLTQNHFRTLKIQQLLNFCKMLIPNPSRRQSVRLLQLTRKLRKITYAKVKKIEFRKTAIQLQLYCLSSQEKDKQEKIYSRKNDIVLKKMNANFIDAES